MPAAINALAGSPLAIAIPALAALALLFILAKSIGLPWVGTVSHFADGDSVESKAWFHSYRVRIRGIDAPEYTQDYGKTARSALVAMLEGRRALFIPFGADRYGRWLCWVITLRGPVSWRMVLAGAAWPASPMTWALHVPARLLGRGLWNRSLARPIHPDVWRRHGMSQRLKAQQPSMKARSKAPKRFKIKPRPATFKPRGTRQLHDFL